jgi:hypothetical protein
MQLPVTRSGLILEQISLAPALEVEDLTVTKRGIGVLEALALNNLECVGVAQSPPLCPTVTLDADKALNKINRQSTQETSSFVFSSVFALGPPI